MSLNSSQPSKNHCHKKNHDDYKQFLSAKSLLREPAITRLITALAYKTGKDMISLAEGMPNEHVFPFSDIDVKLKDGSTIKLNNDKLKQALQYIPSMGLPALIKSLKDFQLQIHGTNAQDKDIITTTGSQDGIYKCFELILNYGDPILIQSPTYTGAFTVLKPFSPELLEIPEDENGMIPEILEQILAARQAKGVRMPKVMYLTPTGSNPSGTVIPNDRRQEIYDIACKYDFIIVEDDPYQFLCYCDETPNSFLRYDVEGRVLRLDSFSKILSSGMRLGWITGPKPLIDVLELHQQASTLHSATLTQVILHELFNQWGVEGFMKHFETVRNFYLKRKNMLQSSLERHLTGLAEWNEPKAGMFYWIKVNGVEDAYDMIVNKAFERGVMFVPGQAFAYDTKAPSPYVRMTFSRASEADMDMAIRHLADLIKDEQKKGLQKERVLTRRQS